MYNPNMYNPYVDYQQQQAYYHPSQELLDAERAVDDEVYRPDDAEDAPTSPPPSQMPASLPSTFSGAAQPNQMRTWMCNCLGKWGFLGLRRQGPGGDFWFYPTEVRKSGVSGYTFQGGRRRKVSYRYSQIRNFMCFA